LLLNTSLPIGNSIAFNETLLGSVKLFELGVNGDGGFSFSTRALKNSSTNSISGQTSFKNPLVSPIIS
jgi:hypothetical protein